MDDRGDHGGVPLIACEMQRGEPQPAVDRLLSARFPCSYQRGAPVLISEVPLVDHVGMPLMTCETERGNSQFATDTYLRWQISNFKARQRLSSYLELPTPMVGVDTLFEAGKTTSACP